MIINFDILLSILISVFFFVFFISWFKYYIKLNDMYQEYIFNLTIALHQRVIDGKEFSDRLNNMRYKEFIALLCSFSTKQMMFEDCFKEKDLFNISINEIIKGKEKINQYIENKTKE